MKIETLQRANEYLKLDFNYCFGLVKYDDAKASKGVEITELDRKVDELLERAPSYSPDPEVQKLAMRLQAIHELRELTGRLAYSTSDIIREVDTYASYVVARREAGREGKELAV